MDTILNMLVSPNGNIFPIFPARVLKAAIPTNSPSYLKKTFDSAQTDMWLTFGLGMDSAAVAVLNDVLFAATYDSTPDEMFSCGSPIGGFILTVPLIVGWQLIEIHVTDTTVEGFADGVSIGSNSVSGVGGGAVDARLGFSRIVSTGYGDDFVTYYRDVKMGTTRGGSELFADDFSGGDLSLWTSVTGSCSLAANPF